MAGAHQIATACLDRPITSPKHSSAPGSTIAKRSMLAAINPAKPSAARRSGLICHPTCAAYSSWPRRATTIPRFDLGAAQTAPNRPRLVDRPTELAASPKTRGLPHSHPKLGTASTPVRSVRASRRDALDDRDAESTSDAPRLRHLEGRARRGRPHRSKGFTDAKWSHETTIHARLLGTRTPKPCQARQQLATRMAAHVDWHEAHYRLRAIAAKMRPSLDSMSSQITSSPGPNSHVSVERSYAWSLMRYTSS
jgi:hypothetical protein